MTFRTIHPPASLPTSLHLLICTSTDLPAHLPTQLPILPTRPIRCCASAPAFLQAKSADLRVCGAAGAWPSFSSRRRSCSRFARCLCAPI
eukprot:1930873-Pleurochrysis_carterae.AAC.1